MIARPDLAAIRERVNAATEGPWHNVDINRKGEVTGACVMSPRIAITDGNPEGECFASDAAFIAAARTDVPALLDYCEFLECELAEARAGWK